MTRHVVVTGASTGIGLATARVLVSRGVHVFGSVRRESDGDRLRAELGPSFTPLLFDVTDAAAIRAAVPVAADALAGRMLWGLVNNAGIAVGGPLIYQPHSRPSSGPIARVQVSPGASSTSAPSQAASAHRSSAPTRRRSGRWRECPIACAES